MLTKPHFVVDPGFNHSKELLSIPRRYRLAARGAWEAAGCWATDKLTDGWVPVTALRELLVTPLLTHYLVQSTLWIPAVDNGADAVTWQLCEAAEGRPAIGQPMAVSAIQFDNWAKWQRTKQQWEQGAKANAARQARFRNRMSAQDDPNSNGVRNALLEPDEQEPGKLTGEERNALRNRIGEERREGYQLGGDSPVGSTPAEPPLPAFPDHCAAHRHNPEPPPCHACKRTREANAEHHTQAQNLATLAAANTRQRNLQRLAVCTQCDSAGWLLDIWGDVVEPATKCQHPGVPA